MFREMRRKDRQAENSIGIELLEKCDYGILSVLGDNDYPYGVPMNFVYQDGYIYLHGFLDGHKIDAIKKHPKVCFTVVGETEVLKDQISTNYTSAIVFGKASAIPPSDSDVRKTAFAALMNRFVPGEEERTNAYIHANTANTNALIIEIEHLSCKQRNVK
jgi:nitroimidazol reductase NimA-like FMN-containing flavoprotein (pyridoxamine 5'-phosphate oxidase superfamily)